MKLKTLVAAAAFSVIASTSFAQDIDPIRLVFTPSSSGELSTTFQRSVSGLFVDTFAFAPAAVSGSVSVELVPLSGPVSFYAALLGGEGFSFLPESGQSSFAFQSNVAATMPLDLTVLGFAGDAETLTPASGSYRGTITVRTAGAAVPEPHTYALMLAGLAAIGAAGRRVSRGTSSRT